jgi:hypothetical protein
MSTARLIAITGTTAIITDGPGCIKTLILVRVSRVLDAGRLSFVFAIASRQAHFGAGAIPAPP